MNTLESPVVLSSSYFPNIQYLSKFLLHQEVLIEINDTYTKQSYRNRCSIYGANGQLDLSVPVIRPNGNNTKTRDILVDYDTKWQLDHWRAIKSAYGNSPFFEIFAPEFAPIFELKEKYLIDLNLKILVQIFNSLGLEVNHQFTESYVPQNHMKEFDFRDSIHPKKRMQKPDKYFHQEKYFQVFSDKLGFLQNLSFIDLMFNEGSQAVDICKKSTFSS